MQSWLMFGLLASLMWGSYIIAAKVATAKNFFNIDPVIVSLLMLAGISIVFVGNALIEGKFEVPTSSGGIALGVLAGALWALGMVFSLKAIGVGADVAKLTPIYNTNTLIAVILGILLLNEVPLPENMIKVLIGAVLIVAGAVLVSS